VITRDSTVEDIELSLLLEGVQRRYGYELREWEPTRVAERVRQMTIEGGFTSISAFQETLLRDPVWLDRLMTGLWSRPNRGMFADPPFWRAVRWKLVPLLRTWPSVRVWVAGCATGEDAWSLAVLLDEEGLGTRAVIHATDINDLVLDVARTATASPAQLSAWEGNHRRAGGLQGLAECFERVDGKCTLKKRYRERIAWSRHVPGVEPSFNEFHLILFRNPFVWTERRARDRVGALLRDSQVTFGFLCLDSIESMRCLPKGSFDVLDRDLAIARRVA
jgi:chemotaxis protein methyltransferase CheR